jgi:hypothetical protein
MASSPHSTIAIHELHLPFVKAGTDAEWRSIGRTAYIGTLHWLGREAVDALSIRECRHAPCSLEFLLLDSNQEALFVIRSLLPHDVSLSEAARQVSGRTEQASYTGQALRLKALRNARRVVPRLIKHRRGLQSAPRAKMPR